MKVISRVRKSRLQLLIVLLTVLLNACGGGGSDGDDDDNNVGSGWLRISSDETLVYYNDDGPYAKVYGTAFTNPIYSMHKCGGLGCIIGSFDNSYPGVDVWWTNNTNYLSLSGQADSRYGTLTGWVHRWSATIPLSVGSNDIDVTASDPDGNIGNDSVIIDYFPPAPKNILIDSDSSQITLEWGSVWGADDYNLYWSDEPEVTKSNGFMIENVESPYTHSGLVNGVAYYYVITSVFADYESTVSAEISAVSGVPPQPTGVSATVENVEIVISWDDASSATSYNLYWANEPKVTAITGTQIADISNPFVHMDLIGIPHYYIVTGVNNFGQSKASIEVVAQPQLPPPAPVGLKVAPYFDLYIKVEWSDVAGVSEYNAYKLERCVAETPELNSCSLWQYWEKVYSGNETLFEDRNATFGRGYLYRVTASNAYGDSEPSEEIGVVFIE